MIALVLSALAAPPAPPAPAAVEPPTYGVVLSVDAYGKALVGHVLVDAELAARTAQLAFHVGDAPRTGKAVPLVDGMRILGLPVGERLVQGGVDTMMYFDANDDKYLDAKDPVFAALWLFVDANENGKVDAGEARTFGDVGIESISRYGSVRMKER